MFHHSPLLVQPKVMMTFLLQNDCSPLYLASYKGHINVVKTLVEAGANVNQATMVYIQYLQCHSVQCVNTAAYLCVYRVEYYHCLVHHSDSGACMLCVELMCMYFNFTS